jgi:membrane protein
LLNRIDVRKRKGTIRRIFQCAWRDWNEDNASRLAASLAYYTALSLAPLVVLGVVLLKHLGLDGQQVIEQQLAMLMGDAGRAMAREMIGSAQTSTGWIAATVSTVVLIWGASNVFAALQDAMNTIWEVQLRPDLGLRETIKRRFLSMAMVLGIGFLLLTSMFVSTVLAALARGIAADFAVASIAVDGVLTFSVTTVFFAAIFAVLPDVRIGWRHVLPGAAVSALLFTVGKNLLVWYLAIGSTTSAFGAAGSLAAVLIWVYYTAQIMFFGAEFTQAHAQVRGDPVRYAADAIPVTKEQRAQLGLDRGSRRRPERSAAPRRARAKRT